MKILHIITSLKVGGAESALCNLLTKFQQQKEHQHYVAYFYNGPNVQKIKSLEIPLFKIKGLVFKYDLVAYFKIKKLAQKINPDIIHSALWSANIFSRLIGHSLKIPVICDLHSNFEHDGKLRKILELFFIKKEATYVAVSTSTKYGFLSAIVEKIKNKKIQTDVKKRIFLIPNGIDAANVTTRALANKIKRKGVGLKETDFVIGSVGRLEPIKSYDILIQSFALLCKKLEAQENKSLKTPKLCLIGDGPCRKSLEMLTINLNIENKVVFLGKKNEACNFYPLFDCFVLSSKSEGLSIALLEALCFGLPVVTTHHNYFHDVIIDRKNGFLVPIGNVEKLAHAIEVLFNSPDLIKKIKEANVNLVKTQFDIKYVSRSYQKLYAQLKKTSQENLIA